MKLPTLPAEAPFTPEQRYWLNGFISGLTHAPINGPATPSAPASAAPLVQGEPVTILWGSQTGNSEGLAKKLAKKLSAAGHQPTVIDMADYELAKLGTETRLLLITSTYGDGEAPDNAADLLTSLKSAEGLDLSKLEYAVFGLGDTEYPDFCQCSKDFDAALARLGAKSLLPRVDSDVDFEEPFEEWLGALSESLQGAIAA
ncbi:MAG: flavodoxin domain-containing protein [Verrucomicrobiales bacterium]